MPLDQPAGVSRAALDVAGEQLDAGQQAADAAHVVVAVAADLVAHAVQNVSVRSAKRLERREAFLELEVLRPSSSGQKVFGTTPFGLNMTTSRFRLRRCAGCEAQAGQVQQERQRRGADAKVAQEFTARCIGRHVSPFPVAEFARIQIFNSGRWQFST